MVEYNQLRETALKLNNQMFLNHPCKTCDGECCTRPNMRALQVTADDCRLIVNAWQREEIPTNTVAEAIKNTTISDACPFYRGSKGCAIYEIRPLICTVYGLAGLSKDTILNGNVYGCPKSRWTAIKKRLWLPDQERAVVGVEEAFAKYQHKAESMRQTMGIANFVQLVLTNRYSLEGILTLRQKTSGV